MSGAWQSPFPPPAPKPTPVTAKSKRASTRAPIYNPYDKFTAPEFDAWIGDITGALRKALNMEHEQPEPVSAGDAASDARRDLDAAFERVANGEAEDVALEEPARTQEEQAGDDSDILEDSFAHVLSRKAKGKARDPREGPGLGNIGHPIELLSDSEEGGEESDSEQEWHRQLDQAGDDESRDSRFSGDEAEYEEDAEEYEEEEEEEEDEVELGEGSTPRIAIEVLGSDDEGDGVQEDITVYIENADFNEEDALDEDHPDETHERAPLSHHSPPAGDITHEEDTFPEDRESLLEDDPPPIELPDPWIGPRTYAEDYYSGGDLVAPKAAGLTPDNLTPAGMTPAEEAGEEVKVSEHPRQDRSASPPSGVMDVDAAEMLPRSSPPPAESDDGNDEVDELEELPSAPISSLPTAEVRASDDARLAALEAELYGQSRSEPSDWDWHAGGTTYHGGQVEEQDEEDEFDGMGQFGALPLGTSDLDIPEQWAMDDDDKDDGAYEVLEISPEPSQVPAFHNAVDVQESPLIGDMDVLREEQENIVDADPSKNITDFFNVDAYTQSAELEVPNATMQSSPQPPSAIQLTDEDSFGELPPSPAPNADEPVTITQENTVVSAFFGLKEQQSHKDASQTLEAQETVQLLDESFKKKYNAWVSEELEGIDELNEVQADSRSAVPSDAPMLDVNGSLQKEDTQPPTSAEPAAATEEVEQVSYIVEEVDDDERLADNFSDVGSVSLSKAGDREQMNQDYIVEDVLTDGRLTAEPDIPVESAEETKIIQEFEAPEVIEVSDEPVQNAATVETVEASENSDDIASSSGRRSPSPTQSAPHTPSVRFASVPAPVSADPTVPDPASPSPRRDSLPDHEPMQLQTPAALQPTVEVIEVDDDESVGQPKSVASGLGSGLFTPVGNGFGPGTPPSDEDVVPKEADSGAGVPSPARSREDGARQDEEAGSLDAGPTIVEVDVDQDTVSQDVALAEPTDNLGTVDISQVITPAEVVEVSPPSDFKVDETQTSTEVPAVDVIEVDEPREAEAPAGLSPIDHQVSEAASETVPPPEVTQQAEALDGLGDRQPSRPEETQQVEDGFADLSYPAGSAASLEFPTLPIEIGHEEHSVVDTDADGEADPDYALGQDVDVSSELDPFKLMGSDSKVAPGAVEGDEPTPPEVSPSDDMVKDKIEGKGEEKAGKSDQEIEKQIEQKSEQKSEEEIKTAISEEQLETKEPVAELVAEDTAESAVSQPAAEPEAASEHPPSSPAPDHQEPEPTPRVLKRKRNSPSPSTPTRVTRSRAGREANEIKPPSLVIDVKGKGKGKGKAAPQIGIKSATDTTSDLGTAFNQRHDQISTNSADISRAASVVSTVSLDSAFSPTRSHHDPTPRSLIHTHSTGFIHHHHHRPAAPSAAVPVPITQSKPPSVARSPSITVDAPQADQQGSTSQPHPTPRRPKPANVSSPVTRSNCRFHKVSLPREEGGPRVSFVVPGCSLGDGELMGEEEIEDHGFATWEDRDRMVTDIESLDFSSYLIGVLRQLVGVDLLREQEVFYLPTPGEHVSKRDRRKSGIDKAKRPPRQTISAIDYAALHGHGSPRASQGSPRPSQLSRHSPTPSVASRGVGSYEDSASATGSSSRLRNGSGRDGTASVLSGDLSDLSDVDSGAKEAPKAKRARKAAANDGEVASVSSASGSNSQTRSRIPILRRSKRRPLNPDAAAYKPTEEEAAAEAAEHASDQVDTKAKRRKSGAKGTKRRRTQEDASSSAPTAKRTRMRKSVSAADATNGA